jgi:hypothetical protein
MVATYEESPQIRTEIDKNKTDVNSIPIQANESPPAQAYGLVGCILSDAAASNQ